MGRKGCGAERVRRGRAAGRKGDGERLRGSRAARRTCCGAHELLGGRLPGCVVKITVEVEEREEWEEETMGEVMLEVKTGGEGMELDKRGINWETDPGRK